MSRERRNAIIGTLTVYDYAPGNVGLSGLAAELYGVEWSPEINEQDTVYSLDEEISIDYDKDTISMSDEDYNTWDNILFGE